VGFRSGDAFFRLKLNEAKDGSDTSDTPDTSDKGDKGPNDTL